VLLGDEGSGFDAFDAALTYLAQETIIGAPSMFGLRGGNRPYRLAKSDASSLTVDCASVF
jgi:hypothetical protein